jgi:prophage regulatory protein
MSDKIIRLPELIAQTGLSRSTIYLQISKGQFPKPISLGARAVGWLQSDIDQWLENLVTEREKVSVHE